MRENVAIAVKEKQNYWHIHPFYFTDVGIYYHFFSEWPTDKLIFKVIKDIFCKFNDTLKMETFWANFFEFSIYLQYWCYS